MFTYVNSSLPKFNEWVEFFLSHTAQTIYKSGCYDVFQHELREDTHKKKFFFSCRTTKVPLPFLDLIGSKHKRVVFL